MAPHLQLPPDRWRVPPVSLAWMLCLPLVLIHAPFPLEDPFPLLLGRITHFLPGLSPGVRCTCSFLPFLGNSRFLSLRPPGFRTHCSLFLQGLILAGLRPPALRGLLLLFTRGGPSPWGGLRRGFSLLHSSL